MKRSSFHRIAWLFLWLLQQPAFSEESDASLFGETTKAQIRAWFEKPQNRQWLQRNHHVAPDRLSFSAKSELDWPTIHHVSPDGRYIFCIQKTGSGENSAAIFRRTSRGAISPIENGSAKEEFSDKAWAYFKKSTGLDATLEHAGIEFIAWGKDRQCVEFSLHGNDSLGRFYLRNWVLHYHLANRQFFIAKGQRKQNEKAIQKKSSLP